MPPCSHRDNNLVRVVHLLRSKQVSCGSSVLHTKVVRVQPQKCQVNTLSIQLWEDQWNCYSDVNTGDDCGACLYTMSEDEYKMYGVLFYLLFDVVVVRIVADVLHDEGSANRNHSHHFIRGIYAWGVPLLQKTLPIGNNNDPTHSTFHFELEIGAVRPYLCGSDRDDPGFNRSNLDRAYKLVADRRSGQLDPDRPDLLRDLLLPLLQLLPVLRDGVPDRQWSG